MKSIYKKCEECDGRGYFPAPTVFHTTLPLNYFSHYYIISEENKCHKCNGTGRIFWGYIEDDSIPAFMIDSNIVYK
jgi:DnaJ-class molecular chaperone